MGFKISNIIFLAGLVPYILAVCVCAKSLQFCSIVCDPMDGSPPGSSVHGIL